MSDRNAENYCDGDIGRLSSEVIKCMQEISSKKKHLDVETLSTLLIENDFIKNIFETKANQAQAKIAELQKMSKSNIDSADDITQQLEALQARIKEAQAEVEHYKQRAVKLHMETLTDTLTGMSNRRAVDKKLIEEFTRFQRYGHPCSLLICDLDEFKIINDTFGHSTGDTVLKKVAHIIKGSLRACDFVGRYGGEEFMVILPDTPADGATAAAEKLRMTVDDSDFFYDTEDVNVTISIGVSQFNKDDDYGVVFDRADKALYEAKSKGRNKVVAVV